MQYYCVGLVRCGRLGGHDVFGENVGDLGVAPRIDFRRIDFRELLGIEVVGAEFAPSPPAGLFAVVDLTHAGHLEPRKRCRLFQLTIFGESDGFCRTDSFVFGDDPVASDDEVMELLIDSELVLGELET